MNLTLTVLAVLGLLTLAAEMNFLTVYAARSFVPGHMNDWRITLMALFGVEGLVVVAILWPAHIAPLALYAAVRLPALIYYIVALLAKVFPRDPMNPRTPDYTSPAQMLGDLIAWGRTQLRRIRRALRWFRHHIAVHGQAL
jgi:hypothetical protein